MVLIVSILTVSTKIYYVKTVAVPIPEQTVDSHLQSVPVVLSIPSLGVLSTVQPVGIDMKTSAMGVPDNLIDVGWYSLGVPPGEVGSAVIAGHRSGRFGKRGVFYDLKNLQIGDEVVVIDQGGVRFLFVVLQVREYDYDADTTDIFLSTSTAARLNLITCSGIWDSEIALFSKRTVVFTELVSTSTMPVDITTVTPNSRGDWCVKLCFTVGELGSGDTCQIVRQETLEEKLVVRNW